VTDAAHLHPIVARLSPSESQLPAVTARGQDVVVTAGAGTGKTRTLVARYLSLLSDGVDLRSIIAITFTKKAAREMRNRIREQIRLFLLDEGAEASDQERWAELYGQLDSARIQTIDSLCREILRQHPVEAGIDPETSVLEQAQDHLIRRKVGRAALSRAASDPTLSRLFTDGGPEWLSDFLEKLLRDREAGAMADINRSGGPGVEARTRLTGLMAELNDDQLAKISDKSFQKKLSSTLDQLAIEIEPAILKIAARALDDYRAEKAKSARLNFIDLEQKAVRLLMESDDVRAAWQEQTSAVLVDEFQDTDDLQRKLVRLLAGDEGKLFIVGDAKQSIYGFRGADVTVFNQEKKRIIEGGGLSVDLNISYRAHHQMVETLNDILRPIMSDRPVNHGPWWEDFEPIKAHRKNHRPGVEEPWLEIHLPVGTKKAGAAKTEAAVIAARLIDIVENSGGELNYHDVAVLCRTVSAFEPFEDAFEAAGVPFTTLVGVGFYQRPELRDVLNGLQAINDPSDDVALYGLLRSPAVGFDDVELSRLSRRRLEEGTSLWMQLGLDRSPRAASAASIIGELHTLSGRSPASTILKRFLDDSNYQAGLLSAGLRRSARNVDKLLSDVRHSGIVSLDEFLRYVRDFSDSPEREGEAKVPVGNAVRLMTIHAAKGLEFPVVVLGDAFRATPNRDEPYLLHNGSVLVPRLLGETEDDEGKLAVRTGQSYQVAKLIKGDRDEAERRRLVYVAATRAEEKLLISGVITYTKKGAIKKGVPWFDSLKKALGLSGTTVPDEPVAGDITTALLSIGSSSVSLSLYGKNFRPATIPAATADNGERAISWDPRLIDPVEIESVPETLPPPTVSDEMGDVHAAQTAAPPDDESGLSTEQRRALGAMAGTLIHRAIAEWRLEDDGLNEWLESRALSEGATREEVRAIVRRSSRLLHRFRSHGLYDQMARAQRRMHEVPYSIPTPAGSDSRLIDALFKDGELWTIVEFKSDYFPMNLTPDHEDRLERYRNQLRAYGEALQAIMNVTPRQVLCLLNFQGGVKTEEMAAQLEPRQND